MSTTNSKTSRLDEFIERPRRALWILAMPMMVGMSLQTVYALVDMLFVGRLGSEALAGLAFNMPLMFLAIGIIFGLGSGVTATIARYIGERDKPGADSAAEHAVALGLLLSTLFTGIAYVWGRELLASLGVPQDVMPFAWDYFSVLAMGYTFLVMSVFFRSTLSGEGDMRTPMMIQGAGTVLNMILDPICIFTLGMGVKGAALATVVSQGVSASIFVYMLFFREHAYVTFDLKHFRFDWKILENIFRVGAPASVSFIIMATGGAVFNRILVEFSSDTVAAFQVGNRIDHVFLLPVISLAAALVTLVGMFYGAKRGDLVRRILGYTMTVSVLMAAGFGAMFFVAARPIVSLFTDSDAILSVGVGYLRMITISYPFLAVVMLTGRALQGMGLGLPVLVLSLLRVVLISAPLALVFVVVYHKPVEWVWGSMVLGMVITAVIGLEWLRRALYQQDRAIALVDDSLPTI